MSCTSEAKDATAARASRTAQRAESQLLPSVADPSRRVTSAACPSLSRTLKAPLSIKMSTALRVGVRAAPGHSSEPRRTRPRTLPARAPHGAPAADGRAHAQAILRLSLGRSQHPPMAGGDFGGLFPRSGRACLLTVPAGALARWMCGVAQSCCTCVMALF